MLPAFFAVLPGLVTGFAGARDRVGAPCRLARIEVGRLDIAADAELAAGSAHDGEVAHDQRRNGERLPDGGISDLSLPRDFTSLLVDGEHAAIQRDGYYFVLPQRDAPIIDAAAGDVARPGAVGAGVHLPIDDALPSGREIDRIDRTPAVRHIHHAVLDQRGGFQIAEGVAPAALEAAQGHREHGLQVLDRIGVDLFEEGEAVA